MQVSVTKLVVVGIVTVVLVVVGGPLVADVFLPEQSTTVSEAAVPADATAIKTGTFNGADSAHDVSGTVTLYRDSDGHFLRFEAYEQTQGPDVFVYLTPAANPETEADIEAGTKVRIDGGADGGESTKEGTFTQRLPADFEPQEYNGVSIWCDDFSVPFGSATLSDV
ncbi:DM13 domain-containing protein [Haladaptatus caseinilyticus]|uniref:DM13 domain-containing protein n=1 Tax=Haladaptatus caseinilyticus TaxID=2993314 RepID=UPI00224B767A|nr:DM13 domain-containing protein [Haladaptatus caseinilyticus]